MSLLGVGTKFEMSHWSYVVCDDNMLPEREETLVGLVDDGIEYPAFRRYGIEQL
jgi:hypothetical protein